MTATMKDWIGHDLVEMDGSKIGRITDIYADEDTGQPEWVAVTTGLFGTRTSFVPLQGLEAGEDVLVSPWTKDQVKDSPNAEVDGALSQEEEAQLYRHYGFEYGESRSDSGLPEGGAPVAGDSDAGGEAITRSEEEMRVDTEERPVGRVRLRKWVETEHQTVTVPVRKEKVRVEREPITDANRDGISGDIDIAEADQEIVLSEERPVVDTEVVPKERVRLDKDVEVVDESVSADVRKERVEVDDSTADRGE